MADEALPKNCGSSWAEKRRKRRDAAWGGGVDFFSIEEIINYDDGLSDVKQLRCVLF
jgi:hypothetical protein